MGVNKTLLSSAGVKPLEAEVKSTKMGIRNWLRENRNMLTYLWPYARKYKRIFALALVISLFLAGFGVALPWVFKHLTQTISNKEGFKDTFRWIGLVLICLSGKNLFEIINHYMLAMLQANLANDIRKKVYGQIHKNPMAFHVHSRTGELASLISNDIEASTAGIIEIYSCVWQKPAVILAVTVSMFYYNPVLAFLAVAFTPLVILSVGIVGRRARYLERKYLDRYGAMMGRTIESLTNVKQVKAFGLEDSEQERISSAGEELIQIRKKVVLLKGALGPIAEISNGLSIGLMAIVAYYQLASGYTEVERVVACIAAAIVLKQPIRRLSESLIMLQRAVAAVQRISWVTRNSDDSPNAVEFTETARRINVNDIDFSYNGKGFILTNIEFSVGQGERIAVIGPSGSGKTTLVDLLIGLYPVGRGNILINGKSLDSIDLKSWRTQVGLVSQEPFLFDDTIENNIRIGDPEAKYSEVEHAARLAGLDKFLDKLPDGMQTKVGERGARLSGGERKRVALARALIKPISVLILDEATSELDPAIEEEILETVDKISANLITFIVSHQKAVLNHCDRVFLLESGCLREISVKSAHNMQVGT
ncbi:MAG: ABC transporter ATP-binding protein/permease [Candidatus Methanoperedenaceae archaeon]|nr:ABC transporter ATP-binding protein/permease [Candidatus Methanoperedenaceae archaeon]